MENSVLGLFTTAGVCFMGGIALVFDCPVQVSRLRDEGLDALATYPLPLVKRPESWWTWPREARLCSVALSEASLKSGEGPTRACEPSE